VAKVKDIMTPYVEWVGLETTLQEAAEKMKLMDLGALIIWDNDQLVGMVTDRDITIRATAVGRDPIVTTLHDVRTPHVLFCLEDQDVSEAAEIMKEKQIRRLAVLNRDMRLVGIVSLGDLALRHDDKDLVADTLERVSSCTS
jgi:CBS domain-containing protein